MSIYTRWYREGSVSATSESNIITGTNTYWDTAGLNAGDILKLGGSDYEILEVQDNTHLKIAGTYTGGSINGVSYSIIRNFTATMPSKIASQVSGLLNDFAKYLDTDMQSIHGKSAYEVAVADGFTGTESQWLESLKAAQEWSKLDERTKILLESEHPYGDWKNAIIRGKNLGSEVTDEQYAEIKAGTFKDMYLGDYWTIDGIRYRIYDFNYWGNVRSYESSIVDPATGGSRRPNSWNGGGQSSTKPSIVNHIMIIPDQYLIRGRYYDIDDRLENGTFHGYTTCNWYRVLRPQVIEKLEATFGANHLLEWYEYLQTSYNAQGRASGRIMGICRVELPTYSQLTGLRFIPARGTLGGETTYMGNTQVDTPPKQLALMQLTKSMPAPLPTTGSLMVRDVLGTRSVTGDGGDYPEGTNTGLLGGNTFADTQLIYPGCSSLYNAYHRPIFMLGTVER